MQVSNNDRISNILLDKKDLTIKSKIKVQSTNEPKYNSLVQNTSAYVIPFLGRNTKTKKVSLQPLTKPERDVKNALDKLNKASHQAEVDANKAYWDYIIDNTPEKQAKLNEKEEKCNNFYNNEILQEKFQKSKNNTKIKNPKLKAELDEVLENFNNFKSEETNADKDYEKLSKLENDVQTKANKFSNPEGVAYRNYISKDIVKLVNARNDYAKKKGYENFYEMKLAEQGKDSKKLDSMFEKIADATKNVENNKKSISSETIKLIASRLGKNNILGLCADIYKDMGWNIMDMPIKSFDLFPRENKINSRQTNSIDTNNDVRVLADLDIENAPLFSVSTLMHELGHAVHYSSFGENLPITQKTITSETMDEGIALLMGSLAEKEGTLAKTLGLPESAAQEIKDASLLSKVDNIRAYIQVDRFEKAMYENPNQDLNKLWKDCGKKYNNYRYSSLEWTDIDHFIHSPAYYHFYVEGEVMAEQLYNAASKGGKVKLTETKDTAKFFNNIFKYGSSRNEDEILKQVTGKTLDVDAYCKQFRA